jgi:hypothetical protein
MENATLVNCARDCRVKQHTAIIMNCSLFAMTKQILMVIKIIKLMVIEFA